MNKENIRFYEDLNNGFLLAYEKSSEFFVRFIPELEKWENCNISFSNFRHDYDFREISKEEAVRKTNGNLPDANFEEYLKLLNRNMGYGGK